MTPKKKSLADRAAEGDYELIVPLDYLMLEILPVEGTTLAGLYEIGTTSKEVSKNFPQLSPGSIATRLRVLSEQGLTRRVKRIGGGKSGTQAWQRTLRAEELLVEWRKNAVH